MGSNCKMENVYGIGVANRYALFLDEDSDPLDILKQSETGQKIAKAKKIFVSKKFGFSKWNRDEYQEMRADGRLKTDGVNVKYMPEHGPLSVWCKTQMELAGV